MATQKRSAAAVMMRPVRSRPQATAAVSGFAAVVCLLDAREQEDRVVGRETEDGGGEQDRLRLLEPFDTGAHLEDEHEHAERRPDGEHVHDEGLQRQDDRAGEPEQEHERRQRQQPERPGDVGDDARSLVEERSCLSGEQPGGEE